VLALVEGALGEAPVGAGDDALAPDHHAKFTIRSAMVSGCSTTAVVWAMTPSGEQR
jgi:hypothetical protein